MQSDGHQCLQRVNGCRLYGMTLHMGMPCMPRGMSLL